MQTQPQLNIPLLRATIASIADEDNLFDMANWQCCIAGHIMKAAGHLVELTTMFRAADLAGIHYITSENLFWPEGGDANTDRLTAIRKLEELIELNELKATPLCSSALESRSRSTRAEAVEKQAEESILVGA